MPFQLVKSKRWNLYPSLLMRKIWCGGSCKGHFSLFAVIFELSQLSLKDFAIQGDWTLV